MEEKTLLRPGLRDVIAGQTNICQLVNGPKPQLYYRGYAIEDLALHSTFEEVVYLSIYNELGHTKFPLQDHDIMVLRKMWCTLRNEPRNAHPMGLLRTALSSLGNHTDATGGRFLSDLKAEQDLAIRLIVQVGHTVGLLGRYIEGKRFVHPKPDRGYAENLLFVLRGCKPSELAIRALDVALILYTEHEFNASSFAVRVASSAHTDMYSAIVVGDCVLKGLRHGGANEEAMKTMFQINAPENVRPYLDRFLATSGVRVPGFGHAVYTQSDPRVTILRPLVHELSQHKGDMRWYETALAMEEYMKELAEQKGKAIPANVDLWTAPLYYLLDIPIPLYTPLFAAARVAGWCAHYLEVKYINKEPIIRPRAEYIGPAPRSFVQPKKR